MGNEEQCKIFAHNLNYYISLTGKSQSVIAKELGLQRTTLNTWCVGKGLPTMGKIQMLADYFHITKSALVDKQDEQNLLKYDVRDHELLELFGNLSDADKDIVMNLVRSLSKKGTQ